MSVQEKRKKRNAKDPLSLFVSSINPNIDEVKPPSGTKIELISTGKEVVGESSPVGLYIQHVRPKLTVFSPPVKGVGKLDTTEHEIDDDVFRKLLRKVRDNGFVVPSGIWLRYLMSLGVKVLGVEEGESVVLVVVQSGDKRYLTGYDASLDAFFCSCMDQAYRANQRMFCKHLLAAIPKMWPFISSKGRMPPDYRSLIGELLGASEDHHVKINIDPRSIGLSPTYNIAGLFSPSRYLATMLIIQAMSDAKSASIGGGVPKEMIEKIINEIVGEEESED